MFCQNNSQDDDKIVNYPTFSEAPPLISNQQTKINSSSLVLDTISTAMRLREDEGRGIKS
jgi:hypothetical protein